MRAFTIAVSEADSTGFGFTCVRAGGVTKADIIHALDFSQRQGARVLIVRCDAGDIGTAQALEDEGFRLADTLLTSRIELASGKLPALRLALPIGPFQPSETEQVVDAARVIFANYFSHYHADPMFDRTKVNEGYLDWVRRSCTDRSVAAEVFVAREQGRIVGLATMRLNDAEDGQLVLAGVHPAHAGKSIYRDLLITGMHWCIAQDRMRMVVSTQVNNYSVQRVWGQLGFRQHGSEYTFHRWF